MNQETSRGVGGKLKSGEFFSPKGSRNENIEIVTSSTSAQEDFFHEKSRALEQEVQDGVSLEMWGFLIEN